MFDHFLHGALSLLYHDGVAGVPLGLGHATANPNSRWGVRWMH